MRVVEELLYLILQDDAFESAVMNERMPLT